MRGLTGRKSPYTRPEAIRGMIKTMLQIVSKDTGEKSAERKRPRGDWQKFG